MKMDDGFDEANKERKMVAKRISLSMDKGTLEALDNLRKISGTNKSALVRRAVKLLGPIIEQECWEKLEREKQTMKQKIATLQLVRLLEK